MNPLLLVYVVPVLLIWAAWITRQKLRSRRSLAILRENIEAGLSDPPSLHPVIDPAICLGCGSCVAACPEKQILGLIDGKAALIEPSMCVGHGACQKACPTGAISLVFGTATRGVDIPLLSPEFETNVPGVFVAGELGGMGLIKNAIEQGRQAIEYAAARARQTPGVSGVHDVVIVGCGPSGIAASLGAMERKLDFVTIDQSTLGGTVSHYPRGKLVMTAPAKLPMIGTVKFGEVSKETLLAFWEDVLARTGLAPHFEEQVMSIVRDGTSFEIATSKGVYRSKTVILAIGRRGTPRALGVPGEDLKKVVYRLIDPEQYRGRRVVVVGGGDSALEAAASLAEHSGTEVLISYRGDAYSRARKKNRDRVSALAAEGRLTEWLGSMVTRIEPDRIEISYRGELRSVANDDVIVCAGGILPTQFLHDIGVAVETKFGTV